MESFFQAYAQGYVDQDFSRIERYFSYPCMLSNENGTDLIADADDLSAHVAEFLAQLKARGLSDAKAEILHDQAHGNNNRVVTVRWSLIGEDGAEFAAFEFLYVLVGGPGAWKISLANLV